MSLPAEFIDRLKAANPIAEVMGSYVNLKRTGGDYVCLCPFHNEKTPSCHIHPDKEYFHCFGCGAGGDVITFTMRYNNLDYWEAVKLLAERGGVPLPEDSQFRSAGVDKRKRIYEMNKKAARFFYDKLRSPEGKGCREYLARRGLKAETIMKYGMGFAPNSWSELKRYMLSEGYSEQELIDASLISRSSKSGNTFDFFVNRAMFPFIDLTGHIVGFGGRALSSDDKRKYLNSKDTPAYNKNRFLFSMNFAKNVSVKSGKILLCEGNLDVISLNQAGFENAVASCGTALTPEQVKLISNYANEAVICYDSDEAGQKATKKAIYMLGEAGLKATVIKMEGAKDPDEYINRFGAVKFANLLEHSQGAVNFELSKAAEGIDTATEVGKNDYMKNVFQVLAAIRSPVERDIYISKVAQEQGISKQAITEEINNQIRKKNNRKQKQEWRNIQNFTDRRDALNPEAASHPGQAKAEQEIIYFLYNNPDFCADIAERLPPEKMVTSFNRRVYESLVNKILNADDHSVSSFNDEFSPEEVGKITSILSEYDDKGIDRSVAYDCVSMLLEYRPDKPKAEEMSDDELRSFAQALKKKKGII